jgi:phospho-N-acetylmuramoyl-pentapeptide-transferase
MAWMGGIGFLDDYLKLRRSALGQKNTASPSASSSAGRARRVTLGPRGGSAVPTHPGAFTTLPFFKYVLIVPAFAWLYVPCVTFIPHAREQRR